MKNTLEYEFARVSKADSWVPACGGHETPLTHNGTRYLYCWNFAKRRHCYLDLDSDMIVEKVDF